MPLRRCSLRPAISIHALREEGDQRAARADRSASDFYPRPPRGGRHIPPCAPSVPHQFLSTPSARRATIDHSGYQFVIKNFYPRPPRGGRRLHGCRFAGLRNFYPRPPRGGRQPRSYDEILNDLFLSTPSARRATSADDLTKRGFGISIHALREEGDRISPPAPPSSRNFYPRPPRGGRLFYRSGSGMVRTFLSTPSARRATPS